MNNIKKLRTEHGLSQAGLAKKLGLTPSAVALYEKGFRGIPNNVLIDLGRYFEVSTDYVLGIESPGIMQELGIKHPSSMDLIRKVAKVIDAYQK